MVNEDKTKDSGSSELYSNSGRRLTAYSYRICALRKAVGPSIHGCVIFIAAMDHLILFTVCCDWFLIVDFDKMFKVCDQPV